MTAAAVAHRPPAWAYASLAASMALVGSYVGLSRLLVAVFPVLLLAWLRFAIAAVAMAHWVRRTAGEPPLSPHDRRLMFWESFLGNFLFSICMLYGVRESGAVAAGVAASVSCGPRELYVRTRRALVEDDVKLARRLLSRYEQLRYGPASAAAHNTLGTLLWATVVWAGLTLVAVPGRVGEPVPTGNAGPQGAVA